MLTLYKYKIVLQVLGIQITHRQLSCMPLGLRFAGSNLAEDDGFLRAKIFVARLPSEVK
jgi:hypothetical protein